MFVGTPTNIRTPNLERITGKPRGPFFVPKGTVLLSLNKTVTSSDYEPVIGDLEFVTDGEKTGEDGYYVELGPSIQWVQIDLGKSYSLNAILIWHFHSQARVYRDVAIQVSDDPDFIVGVQTIYNNDHDNSAGLGIGRDKEYIETNDGRLIDPRGVAARYVRLYSRGNTSNEMNHYVEVEVFGTPANLKDS
ncbi:MAG: discoidin domain-containing protein [Candidatus Aminicenantes bacterium]|nr:discoidin domain-containing protein [Candidatus Aminicenantes bacterium]